MDIKKEDLKKQNFPLSCAQKYIFSNTKVNENVRPRVVSEVIRGSEPLSSLTSIAFGFRTLDDLEQNKLEREKGF
jgi:hypothetical protein